MVVSQMSQDRWQIVPPRPTPVLCLRHTGDCAYWLDTWRTLTALLFEWGLAGPHTRAVGVLYDLPDRGPVDGVRYDACLSVDHADLNNCDMWRCLERVRGLRYEVIMSEAPLAKVGSRHSRRLADMSMISGAHPAKPRRGSGFGAPLYEVYPCSPIFLTDDVPVVEWYQTVHTADDAPVRCAPGRPLITRRSWDHGMRSS